MSSPLRSGPGAWDLPAADAHPEARAEMDRLRQIEEQLRASGNDYWATQVGIMRGEVMAWSAQATGNRRRPSLSCVHQRMKRTPSRSFR